MPKKAQRYAEDVTWDEAVAIYGLEAVEKAAGKSAHNMRARGISSHALARLRAAQPLHRPSGKPVIEVAGVPITAKERGLLLDVQRDLLAILRTEPDRFRHIQQIVKDMIPPEPK
jgi:hypothetical protein